MNQHCYVDWQRKWFLEGPGKKVDSNCWNQLLLLSKIHTIENMTGSGSPVTFLFSFQNNDTFPYTICLILWPLYRRRRTKLITIHNCDENPQLKFKFIQIKTSNALRANLFDWLKKTIVFWMASGICNSLTNILTYSNIKYQVLKVRSDSAISTNVTDSTCRILNILRT